MITKLTTIEELKGIFTELLFNNTDKITKIAPLSVVNGISYGCAKMGQKAIKDIAIIESHIFPDTAFGPYLDKIANDRGLAPRFGSSQSSTYVRVVGTPGTQYQVGVNTFSSRSGIVFDLEKNETISDDGFSYFKVRSQSLGIKTNVDSLTIDKVSPIPSGHQYCVNENVASGGRDEESDELMRARIKQSFNIVSKGTLASIEQAFMLINPNILRLYHGGINEKGQVVLIVLTQNGINLSLSELNQLLLKGKDFFSLTELKPDSVNGYGIELKNIEWQPIDVSARVEISDSFNVDEVRKEIQINLNKHFNYTYWNRSKIEWDDLLQIVKATPGVKYVLDNFFYPSTDIYVEKGKMPRIRGFLLLSSDGSLLSSSSNTLNPVYYPQQADFIYQKTIYQNLN